MTIDLGRVNVLIGENGAGKSNILEAVALAGAADAEKLDNEFLLARGVRVTSSKFMQTAFRKTSSDDPIEITVVGDKHEEFKYSLLNNGKPYSSWRVHTNIDASSSTIFIDYFEQALRSRLENLAAHERMEKLRELAAIFENMAERIEKKGEDVGPVSYSLNLGTDIRGLFPRFGNAISDFLIYSPENSALRTFEREGQIEPLGVNGEGLLKLLSIVSRDKDKSVIKRLKAALNMFTWFKDFRLTETDNRTRMDIIDRFLDTHHGPFDQRSANEGFLFIVFYLILFVSPLTPRFFAIDNIDASLNPRLCEALMVELGKLSRDTGKQVILTTHQPAILDGLDLADDEQRLFVVSRTSRGRTKIRRYNKPLPEGYPRKVSEIFLSGALGGIPKSF